MRRKRKKETVNSYSRELRGFSNNRWGGYQSQKLRTYGGKFGPANEGRSLSQEEIDAIMEGKDG